VSGPLKGEPLVKVNWQLRNSHVQSPFAGLENCSLNGSFINEIVPGQPRKDPNSRIHLTDVSGDFGQIKINSKNVYIDNLKDPFVTCDIKSDFNLQDLNDLLESNLFHFAAGKGAIDLSYSGPLHDNSSRKHCY
jgi:hypothetical protein